MYQYLSDKKDVFLLGSNNQFEYWQYNFNYWKNEAEKLTTRTDYIGKKRFEICTTSMKSCLKMMKKYNS